MHNSGPLNGAHQYKSGKEFVNEIFDSDTGEEDELQEENDYKENITGDNKDHSSKNKTNETVTSIQKQKSKLSKEASQLNEESNELLNLNKQTLRKIVMLVCDEAGFLLEQKLVNLLEPLEKNEKSMVKLDSIFKALGVDTENDVRLLAQYFINHKQYAELMKNNSQATHEKEEQEDQETNESKEIQLDSLDLIHPNEVLSALKTFLAIHHKNDR